MRGAWIDHPLRLAVKSTVRLAVVACFCFDGRADTWAEAECTGPAQQQQTVLPYTRTLDPA